MILKFLYISDAMVPVNAIRQERIRCFGLV